MLESMRNVARTPVIKILFLALIASFALWGIGDVFRGRGFSRYVANVGDEKISTAEFNVAVQQELARFQQLFNSREIPPSVSSAVNASVLERFIDQSILRQETRKLGMQVTDEEIRKRIAAEPAFQENGQFSPDLFRRLLQQNRMTENKYVSSLKQEALTGALISAITSATVPVKTQAEMVYDFNKETRNITIINIPLASVSKAPEPQESDVSSYYQANKNNYATDEFRNFSYITLAGNDVVVPEPTNEEISEFYNINASTFIDSTGKQLDLEQAKADVIKSIKETRLQDILYKTAGKIEDALAGGASLADIAKNFNLKLYSVPTANKSGISPDAKPVAEFPESAQIAEAAFKMSDSDTPSLMLTPQQSYVAVKVDAITPSHLRELSEIRDEVKKDWQNQWQKDEQKKLTAKIRAALAAGKKSAEVAQEFSLPAPQKATLGREVEKAPKEISPSLVEDVFAQEIASPTAVYQNDEGVMQIAVTDEIKLPEKPTDVEMLSASTEVEKGFFDDVMYYYGKNLRSKFTVESYLPDPEPAGNK